MKDSERRSVQGLSSRRRPLLGLESRAAGVVVSQLADSDGRSDNSEAALLVLQFDSDKPGRHPPASHLTRISPSFRSRHPSQVSGSVRFSPFWRIGVIDSN